MRRWVGVGGGVGMSKESILGSVGSGRYRCLYSKSAEMVVVAFFLWSSLRFFFFFGGLFVR